MSRQAARRRVIVVTCRYCDRGFEDYDVHAAHLRGRHRAQWMVDRMDDLNRYAAQAEARGVPVDHHDAEAQEYRALMREWWTLQPYEYTPILMGSTSRATGPDYFRAATIARNACRAVKQALLWEPPRYRRYGRPEPEAPDPVLAAVKAARAVRRVRPDLFEGYQGQTEYGGDVWETNA